MRERIEFASNGIKLSGLLEKPESETIAYALFAHWFTGGKDIAAASRIARALTEHGIAVLRTELLPAIPLIAESIQIQNPDQLNAQQQEQLQVSKELRSQLIEKILRLLRYSQNTQ